MSFLPYAVAAWLFVVGLYGIVTSRHLVHLAVCLTVVQSSTYLILLSVGYVRHGSAPIYVDIAPVATTVDPVVQALTLTDVVVESTITALLLALAVQAMKRFGSVDPNQLRQLRG
ncbi:MAG TPA: NADH-quinone oxidoreductase subunit K [Thermoleophilaceae bacterium]|jgi:multicomponent Na+:H+ antiporter subunit C|nr:NADH-quinone oxidoreductase subunit K [Thermoleophilaceae bacterium]